MMRNLILRSVHQNNLKDIDLDLPLGKAVIITGPSGSGKTSLAFETIYAEGQRRYMQSLSTYARQFLEKFKAPLAEKIQNIPPTIAVEQLNPVRTSRATIGTSTELYDYLRLLFEKLALEFCEQCQIPFTTHTPDSIFRILIEKFPNETLLILCPLTIHSLDEVHELVKQGFTRYIQGNKIHDLSNIPKNKGKQSVRLVLDRIRIPNAEESLCLQNRITESIQRAWAMSDKFVEIARETKKGFHFCERFSENPTCQKCQREGLQKQSVSFSFNNPLGACEKCKGFGNTLEIDETLVVPNGALSLARGAIDPFTKPSQLKWQKKLLAFCEASDIDTTVPYHQLPDASKCKVFEGNKSFPGVKGVFRRLEKKKYKMRIRVFISRYVSPSLCLECHGSRLKPQALRMRVGGKDISALCNLSLHHLIKFIDEVELSPKEVIIARDIVSQLKRRLGFLNSIGLGYLSLARATRSLSGGEYQRILLATQLSQGLTDTLYVLDEPSIGLHSKDTKQLLSALNHLKEQGNSLVIVEHDPEVIHWADYIVDMGPGAGARGGNIVFSGYRSHFSSTEGQTASALRDWRQNCRSAILSEGKRDFKDWLELRGACGNNLQRVDIKIPLRHLVSITGVSGSGKSTLVVDTLYQALSKIFTSRSDKIERFESISGFEHLKGVQLVDQSPIGKSSRSNPITFIKGFDEIRLLFASTREAMISRFGPGHFSFNVKGGRCDICQGEGRTRVDMVFMEEVWIPCDSCNEKRFKPHVLAVRYKGKNIDDCLRMTVDEALDFFHGNTSLQGKLVLLKEVGLGYLQLGQPAYTLSGGEAQRLKIARELASSNTSYDWITREPTLFILDEPTTGLHFGEITRLISVLRKLLSVGHSVVVIEHNLQLICHSDYIIDLGPDGGEQGGRVVDLGTPKELAQRKLPHTGLQLSELLS